MVKRQELGYYLVRLHMKTITRILGVALIIAGIVYGTVALLVLLNIEETARLLDLVGATKREEFGFASVNEWKESMRFTSWFYLVLGLTACVCGIGIVMLQEWARVSWLLGSLALVALFVFFVSKNPEYWPCYADLLIFSIPSLLLLNHKFKKAKDEI